MELNEDTLFSVIVEGQVIPQVDGEIAAALGLPINPDFAATASKRSPFVAVLQTLGIDTVEGLESACSSHKCLLIEISRALRDNPINPLPPVYQPGGAVPALVLALAVERDGSVSAIADFLAGSHTKSFTEDNAALAAHWKSAYEIASSRCQ